MNTEVLKKCHKWIETDNKSFHFNLESNGRLQQPMKFEIQCFKDGGYFLYQKSDVVLSLITIGDIVLTKEKYKNVSCCDQEEDVFDYHGIEKALCGKTFPTKFIPKRILVIQMI